MLRRFLACFLLSLLFLTPALSKASCPVLLASGSVSVYARAQDGSLWGWGDNSYGQLAVTEKKTFCRPVPIAPNLDGGSVREIQAGKFHVLFLMQDGSVFSCGQNSQGQLGYDTSRKNVKEPRQIPFLSGIVRIACGWMHSLALTEDGHVFAWGQGNSGELGLGDRKGRIVPEQLPLENIVDIACGKGFSLALDASGQLYGWGSNKEGQLMTVSRLKPVTSPTLLPLEASVVRMACGNATVYAQTSDGTLWAWGLNDYWQLGSKAGARSQDPVPVPLPEGTVISALSSFNLHVSVLTSQGGVIQWGANGHGQKGTGDRPWHTLDMTSVPESGILDLSVSQYTTCLLREDGMVLSSGGNWYGQAGTQTKISHYVTRFTSTGLNLFTGELSDPGEP